MMIGIASSYHFAFCFLSEQYMTSGQSSLVFSPIVSFSNGINSHEKFTFNKVILLHYPFKVPLAQSNWHNQNTMNSESICKPVILMLLSKSKNAQCKNPPLTHPPSRNVQNIEGINFLGAPFNIASYALLTMMVAQVCDLQLGDFVHTLGDAHLYVNHLEQANLQLTRKPYSLPKMSINSNIKDIFSFEIDDFELKDYQAHDHIKAAVAI